MPREFNFHGSQYDQAAIASVLNKTVDAAIERAKIMSGLLSRVGNAIGNTLQDSSNKRFQSGEAEKDRELRRALEESQAQAARARQIEDFNFRAEQSALDRLLTEQQFQSDQAQRAEIERRRALAGLAERGIAEQGLDANALLEMFSSPIQAPQPSAPGVPPGGPGGYQVAPQQGGGGYQGLNLETRSPQAGQFAGIPRIPKPPTWEERRYQLDQDQQRRVAETVLQFRRLQATGDKNVQAEYEVSLAGPLGLEGLDEFELEQAVLRAYPELTPKQGLDGKEGDRRALDAKLKLLTKKHKVSVPNGAGITGLDWAGAQNDPAVIHAAMEEVFGQNYDIPMNPEDGQAAASKKLLERYPEYALRFHPVQLQGGAELIDQLGEQRRVQGAVSAPRPAIWNKDLLQQAGLVPSQLPPGLQAAASARTPLIVGPDGRIQFGPLPDGTPPASNWQRELDVLQQNPQMRGVLEAIMGVGAEIRQTPSEVQRGALIRSALPPEAAPAERQPRSVPRQASALEAWNEYLEKKKGGKRGQVPAPGSREVPRSVSLIGLNEDRLMQLLLGAGGVR